jgi:AraC-like DNA-binding protein
VTATTHPVRIWRPAELRGATLLRGDLSPHSFPRHTHDETVVGFNVRGAHAFWCRGAVHEVPPGTIALVNAGEVHTGSVLGDKGWDYRAYYLSRDLLEAIGTELGLPGGRALEFGVCAVVDPPLARALFSAHEALGASDTDPLERETRALEALGGLARRHARRTGGADGSLSRQALSGVRDLLRSEYRRAIRLDELQALSGYGKFKLIRAFRTAYGLPPYELVIALRIADARRRLARGEPIARVAMAVGFADQSHLTRHFKRIIGVTPGQYARAFA